MMSGIRCPGFKLDSSKPDPNIKVEYCRRGKILCRGSPYNGSQVVLESETTTTSSVPSFIPRDCVDWSIAFMRSGADRLRAAERQAKEAHKRRWKDWQATVPKITGKRKGIQRCSEIVNRRCSSSIRPPKKLVVPMMMMGVSEKEISRKKVHVVVDYIQEARDNYPEKICATVTINGKNVAEALVSKGLATVVRYRQDDDQRSSRYDDLLTAENKAIKSQLGVHSKKDNPGLRVTEIFRLFRMLPEPNWSCRLFKGLSVSDAIVEFVASGSRLRLYIPKSNSLCTFLLGGINCPRAGRSATGSLPASEAEPYGDEALQFTKEHCLQKEVSIQVDTHDKAGNFIGWLWVDTINMSVALVKEGCASVHFTGEKSQYAAALKSAEESAKTQKLRRWKDYVEEEKEEKKEEEKIPIERKVNYEEVIVTEVTPEGNFFVQKISEGAKAEALLAKLRQEFQANPPLPGAYTPKRGDICAAKFTVDDEWYRVKVEKVQGGKASVLYIDFGNRETLPTTRLASLPAAYAGEKPFATEYCLPYVSLPKDEEYSSLALKYLKDDTAVSKLYLNVEYRIQGSPPAASLHTEKKSDGDIIRNLINEGLLVVDVKGRRQNKLLEEYRSAQENAKKTHSNIWEYGDITEVDAKEFGLGN
ncbi:hypothetical protein NQ317_010354 [Molorchus minor]|uniref:Staphylococcal nuclease domain-containing protein 1 n=1 Tax=Molorchus minor TaxID=1323400 RepID=A0ABQ9IQ45_9CUCU|nr:hypothetical protein NQ317_010354 [Molorchus minor]